jgi:hypothetical protein
MFGNFRNSNPSGGEEKNPITNEDKLITVALLLLCIVGFALIFYFLSAN